jgi:hypothetical protein
MLLELLFASDWARKFGAVTQIVHGLEHRIAGALFHLAGAI